MAYTPELTKYHSVVLRRIAWACQMPMTRTMASIFDHLGKTLDKGKVCNSCRDKSCCKICQFCLKGVSHEQRV